MRKKKPRAKKNTRKKKVSTAQTNLVPKAPEFAAFLDQMTGWFSDHQQQVDRLFGLGDSAGGGWVHLKDFEQGLVNLDVPCQRLQLQTLTQLLKSASDTISYQDLNGQVRRLRLSVGANASEEALMTRPTAERGGAERFVRLRVRLVPFDLSATHPGNFEAILSSRTKVASLTRMIRDRVGIQTCRLDVFPSRRTTEEACLPPGGSLEECGLRGGLEESPAEATVYYDYRLPLADCPLLNCDHYFSLGPGSAARQTGNC